MFSTIQYTEVEERGRTGDTYHVNELGGCTWVEKGPDSNNILDFIIKPSIARQDPIRSQDLSTLLVW